MDRLFIIILGFGLGVSFCVSLYMDAEAPIMEAKRQCEEPLPRNVECVWAPPEAMKDE